MGAREVMRRVRDGYRLERPSHCHPELYKIIHKCWAGDMNKRPDFTELKQVWKCTFCPFLSLFSFISPKVNFNIHFGSNILIFRNWQSF